MVRRIAAFITTYEFWLLWIYALPWLLASSLPVLLLTAALATVPIFWIARRVALGKWSVATPLDLPIVLLLGMGMVGVIVSADRAISLTSYLELFGGVALYYGLVNGSVRREMRQGFWILIVLGAGMGLVGSLGLNYSAKLSPIPILDSLVPRVHLFLLNSNGFTPNIVGGAVALVIPLCWAATASRDETISLKQRVALGGLSVLLCLALFLTESRGAALGLGAALGVLLLWRAPRAIWLIFLAIFAALAALYWFGVEPITNLFMQGDVMAKAAGRLELWNRALAMLQDFPFTGVGLGRFQQVVRPMYPLFLNSPTAPLPHAHNLYLQAGVDYGVPGLVAYIGLITSALYLGILTLYQSRMTAGSWLAAGLLASYVVYLVHGLLDAVAISTKVSLIVWFLLALMARQFLDQS